MSNETKHADDACLVFLEGENQEVITDYEKSEFFNLKEIVNTARKLRHSQKTTSAYLSESFRLGELNATVIEGIMSPQLMAFYHDTLDTSLSTGKLYIYREPENANTTDKA
jgi:hypothetical protein